MLQANQKLVADFYLYSSFRTIRSRDGGTSVSHEA